MRRGLTRLPCKNKSNAIHMSTPIRIHINCISILAATHCSTLQHTAAHGSTLQHTAAHGSTLQHTATHCNGLQHTVTHCNTSWSNQWDMTYLSMWCAYSHMVWLRLVGSLKSQVSFAKEPYERDDILQKRPIILRSLLLVATP